MSKITGYKHPGGGLSWTDQGKINKWNLFFYRFDTATPDHCFSPPTPSACNHLGRGHVLWVVQSYMFSGFFFKVKLTEWKYSLEGGTEHSVMKEAQNVWCILHTYSHQHGVFYFVHLRQLGGQWAQWAGKNRLCRGRCWGEDETEARFD